MYALVTTDADQATSGFANDNVFGAITDLQMSFTVEEPEMWCLVKIKALASQDTTAGVKCEVDVKIDGSFISGLTHGLAAETSAVATMQFMLEGEKLVRLSAGPHVISGWFRSDTDAKVTTLHGTLIPCQLSVLRLSNNSVLAHGVDSKNLGVTQ